MPVSRFQIDFKNKKAKRGYNWSGRNNSFLIPVRNLDETEGLCKEQCSVGCQNKWQRDRYCDDNEHVYEITDKFAPPKANSGCNTAACNYDGGDCPK